MTTQEKIGLKGHKYIALETYRKSGEAVRTPVWFAQEPVANEQGGTTVYVYTMDNSGKAKRIRRASRVRLAPSDGRGKPLGDWVEGEAIIGDAAAYEYGNSLMNKKYGLMKHLFDFLGRKSSGKHVIIQIQLKGAE
jgi:uncharacterized protein